MRTLVQVFLLRDGARSERERRAGERECQNLADSLHVSPLLLLSMAPVAFKIECQDAIRAPRRNRRVHIVGNRINEGRAGQPLAEIGLGGFDQRGSRRRSTAVPAMTFAACTMPLWAAGAFPARRAARNGPACRWRRWRRASGRSAPPSSRRPRRWSPRSVAPFQRDDRSQSERPSAASARPRKGGFDILIGQGRLDLCREGAILRVEDRRPEPLQILCIAAPAACCRRGWHRR